MRPPKIIISGGGTGGHIFPAIAIANAIKAVNPLADILFVGAVGRMEMEKVPAAGYKIVGLKIAGFQRSLSLKNLLFPFKLIGSLFAARKIVSDFKPDVAVGVGGYASGPMLRIAGQKGVPTVIQEQNSYPGLTNKILAKKAAKICVAYQGMDAFFPKEKILLTGNPVRQDIVQLEGKRERGLEQFKLDNGKPVLLVIGGSLGAKTINESIAGGLDKFEKTGLQVIWQTGKSYFTDASRIAQKYPNVRAMDFIAKMDLAYAAADFVVSRAGALSVSELCLVGKPAILVPSPNVAEDHQTKNAMALVNNQAAVLVKDSEARDVLADEVLKLSADMDLRTKLAERISRMALRDSAEIIAMEVLKLVKS